MGQDQIHPARILIGELSSAGCQDDAQMRLDQFEGLGNRPATHLKKELLVEEHNIHGVLDTQMATAWSVVKLSTTIKPAWRKAREMALRLRSTRQTTVRDSGMYK